jgi:hypothetical protein
MYVVVQHRFTNPETAMQRGQRLIRNEGAPAGVTGLQFYPSQDGASATCLWEAPSVQSIQDYVDSTLGDASVNTCYAVDADHSFSDQPSAIESRAVVAAR